MTRVRLNVWGATARAAQLAEVDARETAAEHGWTVAEVAAAVGRRRRAARRPPLLRLGSAALVDDAPHSRAWAAYRLGG